MAAGADHAAGGRCECPCWVFWAGPLLAIVVMYLPFAQVRFAVENRWRAMFEVRAVRDHFRRAPLAFFVALVVTLAVRASLVLAEDRDHPARGGLAAEPGLRGVYLSRRDC